MVPRPDILSGSSGFSTRTSGRSACISQKSQTSDMCDTVLPSTSSGQGCPFTGLEQVEQTVSFLQWTQCWRCSTSSGTITRMQYRLLLTELAKGCRWFWDPHLFQLVQDRLIYDSSSLTQHFHMRVLKEDGGSRHVLDNVEYFATFLYPTMMNRYQSVWSSWLTYMQDSSLHCVDKNFIVS